LDDRNGELTDILKPLANDADRKLVLERALRAIGSTLTVT
jgi:hypothetical protein